MRTLDAGGGLRLGIAGWGGRGAQAALQGCWTSRLLGNRPALTPLFSRLDGIDLAGENSRQGGLNPQGTAGRYADNIADSTCRRTSVPGWNGQQPARREPIRPVSSAENAAASGAASLNLDRVLPLKLSLAEPGSQGLENNWQYFGAPAS